MPSWKKVIISGSNAALNSLTVTNGITGSLFGTASYAVSASQALTASYAINPIISGSINNVDYIDFNTGSATPAWESGRVFWDNTDGCLAVYNNEADITLQVGQENWTRVSNNTGTTITNGTAVRLNGAQGDVPTIVRAQSIAKSGSANIDNQILGIATHDIEDNSFGYVTTQGLVRGLNTNAFNDGDTLFVGTGSAGVLQNTAPRAPFEIIPVGVCVKASPGGSGIIYVAVQQPIDFSDLSSVLISGSYNYGDLWTYERSGSLGVWKHTNQLSGSYGLTGSLANGLDNIASGQYSHAQGQYTTATGDYSHAEGTYTTAAGIYSHAEGSETDATGPASHAEGENTQAIGQGSHAEGNSTTASGLHSHAEGFQTQATGLYSHTEGSGTSATTTGSHAEGLQTRARGIYSHAEGFSTVASGSYSHAEGVSTLARGFASHAEGNQTQAIGAWSHAEGEFTQAIGEYSHAEGFSTIASGSYSHAEGNQTQAIGDHSHAEGAGTQAIGQASHAEGADNQAIGYASHTEGDTTQAIGDHSHAEGAGTQAIGQASHAEGVQTQAIGEGSHAEGEATEAIGSYSHAEGDKSQASGSYSHAEGQNTQAIGDYSHAEGKESSAIGENSHAEGAQTQAIGGASHAEGLSTQAIGGYSHAEGLFTTASGDYSHAEGFNTVASGSYQHVQGQYNISSSAQSAFIIGNGTSNGSRSNLVFASGSEFQVTGSLNVSGSSTLRGNTTITGSFTVVTGSARELQVTSTGVDIGNVITDTHTVTGSLNISGSLNVNGNIQVTGSATISGSISTNYFTTSSNYTVTTTNSTVELTGANTTASLYTAVGNQGRQICIKNGGTGIIFITGSQTIDGNPNRRLGAEESLLLQSDGSNWTILNFQPYVLLFGHESTISAPADNTTYYFGNFFIAAPSTVSDLTRQVRANQSGWATYITLMVAVAGTLATSEDSTLVLANLTRNTTVTITSTLEYNVAGQQLVFTLATPLQIVKGDLLEMRWTTPTWTTNPAAVRHMAQVSIL